MTESQKRYDKLNTVKFTIKLNVNTDGKLIKMLNTSDNKQGLIKRALYNYLPDTRIINNIRAEVKKLPDMDEAGVFSSVRMKSMVLDILNKYSGGVK